MALALVLAVSPLAAQTTHTIRFDELPFQPVHGLTFNGVSFFFSVLGLPSLDANFASGGPGTITFVQDPSLEGNAAGQLLLQFLTPASFLSFGVAMSIAGPASLTAALFDPNGAAIGVAPISLSPLVSFAEGQFSYAGPALGSVLLDFDDPGGTRFAFDNLVFTDAVVPEPATLTLMATGLCVVAAGAVRRRRRR